MPVFHGMDCANPKMELRHSDSFPGISNTALSISQTIYLLSIFYVPQKHDLQGLHGTHSYSKAESLQTLLFHSGGSSHVPLWPCAAIWVNPTRVTTVMAPMHIGTGKGVNTPRPAGTMQILTTGLAGRRSHVHTPADNKARTEWSVPGILVRKKMQHQLPSLKMNTLNSNNQSLG